LGFWIGRKSVRVEGLKMGLNLRRELGEIVGGVKIRVLEREGLRVFEKKLREKELPFFFKKKICLVLGKLPSLVLSPTTPTFPSRSQCPHHSLRFDGIHRILIKRN
jgi:hypothetical protein